MTEALDGRVNLGEGSLRITELIHALPDSTALSLEVRSARLRREFVDPTERAQHVLAATRRELASVAHDGGDVTRP